MGATHDEPPRSTPGTAHRDHHAELTRPERLTRHERLFAAIGILGALSGLAYFFWRVLATGRGTNPVLFWALLAAEAYGIVSFLVLVHTAWRIKPTRRGVPRRHYDVDVFVCTYDESSEVVEATLAGCQAITYPHTTWLLDDGRRPEMRDLAEAMDARYLTRSDNAHAKAGNVNAALPKTTGDLILVLDADHVPLAGVLDATVAYFDDPRMAVVQTPHDFYNRDSVQHSHPHRHEQSLFYDVIAPGKSRHNAAYWCGSAAVIRRAALDDVGGVLTATIAEDFHTTIAMHERGWHSRYHNEVLVQGLAPHDLDSFLLQRDRWARGNLWVLRTRESPLTARGLSFDQRVSYLGSLLGYGSGLYRLTLLAVLSATLLTGRLPLAARPVPLLAFWLPWMLLTTFGSLGIGRGAIGLLDAWRYGLLTMGIFTRSVVATALGRSAGRFKVTPKAGLDDGGLRVLRAVGLLTTMTVVLSVAVVVRAGALAGFVPVSRMPAWAEALSVALGVWTLSVIVSVMLPLVRRRQHRATWRFPVSLRASTDGGVVPVVDLTPDGAAALMPSPFSPGDVIPLRIRIPGPGGQERTLALDLEARSCRESGDAWRVGGRFASLTPRERALLVHYCYVVAIAGAVEPGTDGGAPPATTEIGGMSHAGRPSGTGGFAEEAGTEVERTA